MRVTPRSAVKSRSAASSAWMRRAGERADEVVALEPRPDPELGHDLGELRRAGERALLDLALER